MRVCIFSDIHGNQYVLRKFEDLLPSLQIDSYIFCGDIFGYYYGQEEILEFLSNLPNLVWLLGNHDKNFIDIINGTVDVDSMANKYGNSYTIASLHKKREEFVNTLYDKKPKVDFSLCDKRVIAIHGTKDDPLNGRLYPKDEDTLKELVDVDICIMGHTHFRLNKQIGNTLYLNPGSLGQPRDRKKPCFIILTLPECSVEFVDLNYDTTALEFDICRYDVGNEKLIELLYRSD